MTDKREVTELPSNKSGGDDKPEVEANKPRTSSKSMLLTLLSIPALAILFLLFLPEKERILTQGDGVASGAEQSTNPYVIAEERRKAVLEAVGFTGWALQDSATTTTPFFQFTLSDPDQVVGIQQNGMILCHNPDTDAHPLMVRGLKRNNKWTRWSHYHDNLLQQTHRVEYNAPEVGVNGNLPMTVYVIRLPYCIEPGRVRYGGEELIPYCSLTEIKPELHNCDNERTRAIWDVALRQKLIG